MGRVNKIRWAAMAATLAATMPATAADWDLDAGVTARETYSDNVKLSATNPQSDFITAITPYVSASKKGSRFEADFRYSMQSLFYADQSSDNGINHNLAALAKAELYEDELFLDASAAIFQQFTSLTGAVSTDPANASDNLTDIYTASISPYWQHRFGSFSNLLARYRHSEVQSSGDTLSSSTIDAVNVALTSGTQFRDWSWSLNYSDQTTDYSDRSDVDFSSRSATLGYGLTSKLRLNGTVGYQDNSYLAGRSELTGTFWTAGVAWAPNNRTSINVGYGHYPYGNSPSFTLTYRARYWTLDASYATTLTTTSSEATVTRPIFLGSGVLPGGRVVNVFALDPTKITTNQVYQNERFQLGANYAKGRSTVGLTVYRTVQENREAQFASGILRSDAFQFGDTIKQHGATANWGWKLTPTLTSRLGFDFADIRYSDTGREDRLYHVRVGLDRTFNRQLSGLVEVRHQQRDSNVVDGDYDENAVIGSINYKF